VPLQNRPNLQESGRGICANYFRVCDFIRSHHVARREQYNLQNFAKKLLKLNNCTNSHNKFFLQTSASFCSVFSARCNIYILRLCYDVSVRLSVAEVHWRIILLGFKLRSQFTAHCGRGACGCDGRDHRQEEWRDHLALC